VRPVGGIVTLPAHRPVELPDPGSVVVRGIDRCPLIIKESRQHLEGPLHQVPALVIIREINPVEEMSPIP